MISDLSSILAFLFYAYLAVTVIFLLLDNRDSSTTFAWFFVFIIFPVGGLFIYLLIGRNWRNKSIRKTFMGQHLEKKLLDIMTPLIEGQGDHLMILERDVNDDNKRKLFNLLYRNSNSILTGHNRVKLFLDGQKKFDALLEDISLAEKSIHMEYFIWRSDSLTKRFKKVLTQKVQEGVEVRILYDAIGSVFLNPGFIHSLRKAGVKIYPYYNFLSPLTIHTLNYRNHRKIVVIDGKVGYTGGMNMGREYVDGGKRFPSWKDTHTRIEGEAAQVLQSIFVTSWFNTTREDLFTQNYFPKVDTNVEEHTLIQVTTSGPDSQWRSIQQLYFSLISSANKKVYIQSPYFIPDASIIMALKTAALSGLDVKIMITGLPDKKLPYWSAFTFFEQLLEAGVKIYHYKKGFMHSKTITVDGDICSIGTANMDVRSFHINYEINTLIYDKQVTQELSIDFENDLKDCREFTLEDYRAIPALVDLRNSAARLFAPLL